MIVNGRKIARDIVRGVRESVAGLPHTLVVRAIVLEPSPATESYLRIKERRAEDAGMHLEVVRMNAATTTEDVVTAVREPGADAVIVQLPLPQHIESQTVLDAIAGTHDADVLSSEAHRAFEEGTVDALLPPVVEAMREILVRSGVNPKGMRAVVVGQGWLVGEPSAAWLSQEGARVSVVTLESGDMSALKGADIVVSGAGVPGLIQPGMLKQGVVLIDAGTSESDGSIVGDADPACAELASVYTPVPGGVGPIAVACLFKNVATLALRKTGKAL